MSYDHFFQEFFSYEDVAIFYLFQPLFIGNLGKKTYFKQKKVYINNLLNIIFQTKQNEVNRTFLALSNNYHAPMSPKPNQEPEVCHIYLYLS